MWWFCTESNIYWDQLFNGINNKWEKIPVVYLCFLYLLYTTPTQLNHINHKSLTSFTLMTWCFFPLHWVLLCESFCASTLPNRLWQSIWAMASGKTRCTWLLNFVCVSLHRTESWDRRRSTVRALPFNSPSAFDPSELRERVLTWHVHHGVFFQSSVRRLWSLTGTRKATSVTKTWGSAWGPWGTCPQRWSSLNWASRSVSRTETFHSSSLCSHTRGLTLSVCVCVLPL